MESKIKFFSYGGKEYKIIDTKNSRWISGAYGYGGCSYVEFNVEIKMRVLWMFYMSVFKKKYTMMDYNKDRIQLAKNEYFYNKFQ